MSGRYKNASEGETGARGRFVRNHRYKIIIEPAFARPAGVAEVETVLADWADHYVLFFAGAVRWRTLSLFKMVRHNVILFCCVVSGTCLRWSYGRLN